MMAVSTLSQSSCVLIGKTSFTEILEEKKRRRKKRRSIQNPRHDIHAPPEQGHCQDRGEID